MSFFENIYRKIFNFTADLHHVKSFPWFSWAEYHHGVDFDEILEVLPLIKYGDVGLHRDKGYLSNLAVPGYMKHAWIQTEDGLVAPKIVEAVSEGVLYKNAIYPLYSDYAIIVSPKNVTDQERGGACLKAKQIIGVKYDINFKFDIEKELEFYTGQDTEAATRSLEVGVENIQHYDAAFTCTEVVSYAWWHRREQLRLFRHKVMGKNAIIPDDFLNGGWEIKWLSRSVTPDSARKLKLHEEGIHMIEEFLGK